MINKNKPAEGLCAAVLSSPIHLRLILSRDLLPQWGVVLHSVFGRRNSINISVFSVPGWIEPVEPPMQGLPNPVDEV